MTKRFIIAWYTNVHVRVREVMHAQVMSQLTPISPVTGVLPPT